MGFWLCKNHRCGQGGLAYDVFDIERCEGCGFGVDYFEHRPSAAPQAERRGTSRRQRNRSRKDDSQSEAAPSRVERSDRSKSPTERRTNARSMHRSERQANPSPEDDPLRRTLPLLALPLRPLRRRETSLPVARSQASRREESGCPSNVEVLSVAAASQAASPGRTHSQHGVLQLRERREDRVRSSMADSDTTENQLLQLERLTLSTDVATPRQLTQSEQSDASDVMMDIEE